MWQFLGSVLRAFLLLRDLFGYLIPGTVLLGSVVYAHQAEWMKVKANWPGGPDWLAVVAAVIGCYVLGQVLAAIGYFIIGIVRAILQPKPYKAASDADLLFFHYVYPDLFLEYDRRSIVNIMRIGLSVALLVDAWLLPAPLNYVALIVGLFLLYNGYTGAKHVAAYGVSTVAAGKEALKKKVPVAARK